MKAKKYYVILTIVTGIFCVSALSQVESPSPADEPFLLGRPHPALAGIDKLCVAVFGAGAEPEKDGLAWTELEAKIINKLNKAGIKPTPGIAGSILEIAELRVYINALKLEDSRQYVFRTQTSLARAVHLVDAPNPVFKADVWRVNPAMKAVPVRDMPAEVTNVVLEQVEVFIHAYKAANPPGGLPPDAKTSQTDSPTAPERQGKPDSKSAAVEYEYVASRSSNVFHKPECRWAK
ncbi:MAG: hypothetical protein PVJ86_04130, partial [Phycisphaerales bacterium]